MHILTIFPLSSTVDKKVPNLKLSAKPLPIYTLPEHIQHSAILSYIVAGVVICVVIAIIIIFIKYGNLNPSSLTTVVASLLMQQIRPVQSLPLETDSTVIIMEGFQTFLLLMIALSSIILLIMLHKSNVLKLFSSHTFTHGHVKVTTIDKNNPTAKATAFRQSFRKIAKKAKVKKLSDDQNILELKELLTKQKN